MKMTKPSEQPVPRLSLETEAPPPKKRGRNANQSPAKIKTDFISRICDMGRYLSQLLFVPKTLAKIDEGLHCIKG